MFPSTEQILQQYPETPTDERLKPHIEVAPNCPRCASTNTKFCYYNNYSLSQPRYFCKGCRRYWTKGGSLRNIPVGGGCRKSRNRARPARISSGSISRCGGPDAPFLNSSSDSDCSRRSTDHVEIDLAAVFAKFLNPNSSSDHNNHTTCPSDNKFINSESSAHTVAIYSESSLQQEPLDLVDNTQASLLDEFPDMIIYGHQQQQGTFEGMVDYDLSASCFDKGVLWSDSLDDAALSNFSWQPMVMDGGSIEHVGSFGSM